MSSRFKLFIPLLIFIVIAGVFLVLQQRLKTGEYDPSALPSALVGKTLPQMALPLLGDAEQLTNTSQINPGKPFILNVWATWCIACRAEHEYLNQLAKNGITVVGLNYKDERSEALRWLENLGNPYKFNLFDSAGEYGLEIGVYGAPESYIVDGQGIVRYRHVGVLNQRVWEKTILPLGVEW